MRITDLDSVLFDVGLSPLFFEGRAKKRVAIPGRQAVVDLQRERWLGVVGESYRLVPNREALEFARQCACQCHALLLSPGKLIGTTLFQTFQVHPREPLIGFFNAFICGQMLQSKSHIV